MGSATQPDFHIGRCIVFEQSQCLRMKLPPVNVKSAPMAIKSRFHCPSTSLAVTIAQRENTAIEDALDEHKQGPQSNQIIEGEKLLQVVGGASKGSTRCCLIYNWHKLITLPSVATSTLITQKCL